MAGEGWRGRLARLELAAETGPVWWRQVVAEGQAATMKALEGRDALEYAPQVRQVFAEMRDGYAPGMDADAAADRAIDALKEVLPLDVFACVLGVMTVGRV